VLVDETARLIPAIIEPHVQYVAVVVSDRKTDAVKMQLVVAVAISDMEASAISHDC
jgi:hypothetical protein